MLPHLLIPDVSEFHLAVRDHITGAESRHQFYVHTEYAPAKSVGSSDRLANYQLAQGVHDALTNPFDSIGQTRLDPFIMTSVTVITESCQTNDVRETTQNSVYLLIEQKQAKGSPVAHSFRVRPFNMTHAQITHLRIYLQDTFDQWR